MNALSVVFNVLSVLLILYLVLILMRVLSSWFSGTVNTSVITFLRKATDPFIRIFSRLPFSRIQNLDLSPILAMLVLIVLIQIFQQVAAFGVITFGIVLAILLSNIGSTIGYLFAIFLIIAVVRFIGTYTTGNQQLWSTLDHMLQPMIYPVLSRISPNRVMGYRVGLIVFAVICGLLWVGVVLLFNFLANRALGIPF